MSAAQLRRNAVFLLGAAVSFAIGRAVGSLPLAVLAGLAAIALAGSVPAAGVVGRARPDADVRAGAGALADRLHADWVRTGMVTPVAAADLLRTAVGQLGIVLDLRAVARRAPDAAGPMSVDCDRLVVRRLALLGRLADECRAAAGSGTDAGGQDPAAYRACVDGFGPPAAWARPGSELLADLVQQVDAVDDELERAALAVAAFREVRQRPTAG